MSPFRVPIRMMFSPQFKILTLDPLFNGRPKENPFSPGSRRPPKVNSLDQNTIGDQFFDCALTKRDSFRQLLEVEVFALHVFFTLRYVSKMKSRFIAV